MRTISKLTLFLLVALIGFVSCKDDNATPDENIDTSSESRVVLMVESEAQSLFPLHVVEDAESGSEDIVDAQEILNTDEVVLVASKDGNIYLNDFTGNTFKKMIVGENGILEEAGSVPNLGTNHSPLHAFLDDDRILHTSAQTYPEDGIYSYQIINTATMEEEVNSTFKLPFDEDNADFAKTWANDYVAFEGNVLVPFVETDIDWVSLSDTALVAIYDASMNYKKTIKTSKTAALCNGFNPSYAISENGDLYMCSSNTDLYNAIESKPSGIVRIKAGTTEFDDSYFLNVTEKTGFHTLGMLYVGDNKAIVQVFNSDVWDDTNYYVEYYLADLANDQLTKLDIPASFAGDGRPKYIRRTLALLANGKAAIVVNTTTSSSLYIYDPTTGSVSQGVEYEGADVISGVKAL